MTRLWDKGASLDARVLDYTAGEDHALDERLVPYDVRASIAHAEMLNAGQLLSASSMCHPPRACSAASAPSASRSAARSPDDSSCRAFSISAWAIEARTS